MAPGIAQPAADDYITDMEKPARKRSARMIGLGLDTRDGHVRITRGENFDILLGSEETHERMQTTCIKLNEKLAHKGKRLDDLSRDEFFDLVSDVE